MPLALAGPVLAYEPVPDLQVHGFLSQGAFHTDHNEIFGSSSTGFAFDAREIGLNASWQATPELRIAGQLLSRRAGESDDGDLRLDYGLLDWTPYSSEQQRAGIRLGRVKMPLGLYNETRDVAHTRPGILMPQSIYAEPLRNIMLSADGLTLYGEQRTDIGDFFLDLQVGRLRENDLDDVLGASGGSFDAETSHTWVARLSYDRDSGRFRAGLYGLQADIDLTADADSLVPGLGALLPRIEGTLKNSIYGLFAQYNERVWSLTGEWQRYNNETTGISSLPGTGQVIPDQGSHIINWYLQVSYRFKPRWESFLRYDKTHTHSDYDSGIPSASQPDHRLYARDWTLGVGWFPTEQLLLRAEFHHVDGTAWLPIVDNPDPDQIARRWNIFALEVAYRF